MAESDVFVRFGADIGPLEKGVNQASNKLGEFGAKSRHTANQLGKLAAASAVAGAAIGAKLVSDSLAAIDAQAKLARQLGTSSASIATLNRAADMSGISMKSIEAGAKNLEVAMGEAAQGTGVAVDTLKRLNLTAKDLEGMTLDQKLLTVNQALKDNIPANERAAAAADLFGKRAGFAISQLDPATLTEATRQVEGMGLAISDVDAAKIEAANDAMSSIQLATDGIIQQFTIALAPVLEDIALYFQEMAIETGGFKETGVDAVNALIKGFGYVGNAIQGIEVIALGLQAGFSGLKAVSLEVFAGIAEGVNDFTNGAIEKINGLIEKANSIPLIGLDIAPLESGDSSFAEGLRAQAEAATAEVGTILTELHNKLMEPLPSEVADAYIESLGTQRILENKQAEVAQVKEIQDAADEEKLAKEEEVQRALAKIKQAWGKDQTRAVSQMFGDLSSLQQSGNKKLFEVGKKAAMAQTVMSTYEGAQKAYTSLAGIPIVGPALGAAAAGAAIVAGGIRLQSIASTTMGGGSSVNAGATGGGAATGGDVGAASAPQPEQSRTVRIEGFNSDQLFTGDQLNSLAEKLVEYQEDGFKLVV